jgi:hypothetical protein
MSKSLKQFLRDVDIHELALPANVHYGTAIYERGGVEIITAGANFVEGWVGGLSGNSKEGGGSRRRTRLSIEDGELTWHCAGNPKTHDIFCKHCVGLALYIIGE